MAISAICLVKITSRPHEFNIHIREIDNKDGLIAAFKMRYEVYLEDPHLCYLIDANPLYISLDGYDTYAHHYGIYWVASEKPEILVGYIRLICEHQNLQSCKTISLIADELRISLPHKRSQYNFNGLFSNISDKQILEVFNQSPEFEICEAG